MALLRNRFLRAYLLIGVGALLFWLRRLLLPSLFEQAGLPFDIAVPSVLNSCIERPALNTCADPTVVVATIVAVVVALGWGHAGMAAFAVILAIAPLMLYFAGSPILAPLLALAFIPLALAVGLRLLVPGAPDAADLPPSS